MTGEQFGGLEVVAWRYRSDWWTGDSWGVTNASPSQRAPFDRGKIEVQSLTPAEPAEARIRELEAELEEARTIDAGLWKWLGERDLQPDGPDVEWSDIVVALTEHETNAYDLAEKAEARATAAEAKLARAVEGLERIAHVEPYDQSQPYELFKGLRSEARQTLAALQQEGE